jgi:hypothetical protein
VHNSDQFEGSWERLSRKLFQESLVGIYFAETGAVIAPRTSSGPEGSVLAKVSIPGRAHCGEELHPCTPMILPDSGMV